MADNNLRHFATGSGDIASTLEHGSSYQIEEVRLHLSAAGGANNFTITVDHGDGTAYDIQLSSQDMTSVTDYVYVPTRPYFLRKTDKVVFSWTNASARTYGLEVLYKNI